MAHNDILLANSRKLRTNQTLCEQKIWNILRKKQLGYKFIRQHVIDNKFIVDFFCAEKKLIIEIDDGQHCENKQDFFRDNYLTNRGFHILRFWNNDISDNLEGCILKIKNCLDSEF